MCWWLFSISAVINMVLLMRRTEILYSGHLSLNTSLSWKGLPHLSHSGWKLISILLRSWSVSFTFLSGFRGRQIWSLKGITDTGWGIVTSQFCFSSPPPLYSVWNCSATISTITYGVCVYVCTHSGARNFHAFAASLSPPRQHDLLNLP